MFVTIMRTVRISDLRRGHRTAGFVPKPPVGSFHRNDSAGFTIVTIERDSSDRLSTGPYIYALHAHRARPLRVSLLYRVDNRIHVYSTNTSPFRASAEVLANYNISSANDPLYRFHQWQANLRIL